MKKYTFFIMGILLPLLKISAQPSSGLPNIPPGGITVGQPCPDVTIGNIIHYPESQVKISDFRGKLLILDFWATWCGSCIESLRKFDSLQRKFQNDLFIISVTIQKPEVVKRFIESNKILHGIQLPFAVKDTILKKIFKYNIIPHIVLIDRKGVVRAITYSSDITAKSIKTLLQKDKTLFQLKKDQLNFNVHKPLLIAGNGGNGKTLLYHSLITGPINGIPSATGRQINNTDSIARVYANNVSILQLYKMAFGKYNGTLSDNNRIILDIKDRDTHILTNKNDLFCYDLVIPHALSGSIYKFMQQDLNRYFSAVYGIEADIKKRKVKCLILTDKREYRTSSKKNDLSHSHSSDTLYINDRPPSYLVRILNRIKSGPPVLNESHSRRTVNLIIARSNLSDIDTLNAILIKSGLMLVKEYRYIDMLVISDKKK